MNVDSEGNIYVAEKLNYPISKISPEDQFITTRDRNSTAEGDFRHIHAVVADSKTLFMLRKKKINQISKNLHQMVNL